MRHAILAVLILLLLVAGCETAPPKRASTPSPAFTPTQEQRNWAEEYIQSSMYDKKVQERDAEYRQLWKQRNEALSSGRVYIGMPFDEFAEVWGKLELVSESPRFTESKYEGHTLSTFEFEEGDPDNYHGPVRHITVTFDNGRLDSIHDSH